MLPLFVNRYKIPHNPGVYIYKDSTGRILYVGKAIDLYHRVSSYFSGGSSEKTALLVKQIADIETMVVESELESLILEANLIKKYLPPFNVRLTDDKDYLYIAVTKGDFPKIITARKKDLKQNKKYWGPFPSSRTVKETLKSLRRVFPWCSTAADTKTRRRPCFYLHLGLCPGACIGLIDKKNYQKIILRFSKFMDGRKNELIVELTKELNNDVKDLQFEKAGKIKKTIAGITYMTQSNRTKLYLESPNFLEDEKHLALEELKKDLHLKELPERIEGYDISNIQGKEATGSMVVLTNGEIDKSQYRKFKIKISGKPNDLGMLAEMVKRRLKHPEWPLPDLIIVDGGKGQSRAANYELQTMNHELPIFGLAKRMEWLYPPEGEVLKLPKKSLSLKLLQKLRDEAHRFSRKYHFYLRRKKMLE